MSDIASYIWKDRRLTRDKNEKQMEYKMVDMTENQLQQIYNHCKHMLYNTDPKTLGRMVVIDQIAEQLDKCAAELALRWFKEQKNSKGETIYTDQSLYTELKSWLNAIKDYDPNAEYHLGSLVQVPATLQNVKMHYLIAACKDQLGIFDHSKLTYNFIYNLGVYFTPSELKELEEWSNNKQSLRLKIEDLKLQLSIENAEIRPNPFGLTAQELRDMIHIKRNKGYRSCKYSQLSTSQLETLRNKVLYFFEDLVCEQVRKWQTLMTQIEEVAKYKNYSLS